MSKFDMIIGYLALKKELMQIADTLHGSEAYERLGVSVPRGLLLYGQTGVGKSLMAGAIIEESGRQSFSCRKDQPNVDFVKEIKATFDKAIANEPAIVFLDDIDNLTNGDEYQPDADEYVTVQACIDEIREKEVFVLSTANDIRSLPRSLRMAGCFDKVIEIEVPHGQDAERIIEHYLSTKKIAKDVDVKTIARIMAGRSFSELETVVNEAGLYAGYERAESITMEHFMKAFIRTAFGAPLSCDDNNDLVFYTMPFDSASIASQIVYHEAGHAVVSEILCPDSVTLVSVHNRGRAGGGFTHYYNDNTNTPLYWAKSRIVGALGGMAAIEQKYGIFDVGCEGDLDQAFGLAKDLVVKECICGLHLHGNGYDDTERLKSEQEQAVSTEVEKFYRKAKEIIASNYEFLESVAVALAQKHLLSAVDIKEIIAKCKIVSVTL